MNTQRICLSASTIQGDPVYNNSHERIGTIKAVMLNLISGNIAYLVLSFGGVMGVGDKLFAIPFKLFKPNIEEKAFYLNIDKDKLENLRGFDRNNWPDFSNARWDQEQHSYFNVTPYPPSSIADPSSS